MDPVSPRKERVEVDPVSEKHFSDSLVSTSKKPNPDNFEVFLPWACHQLRVNAFIQIIDESKVHLRSRATDTKSLGSDQERDAKSMVHLKASYDTVHSVKISILKNKSDSIVQLKFDKNLHIPRQVFKVIGLILQYHVYLSSIIINRGINQEGIYELNKMILMSHITEVCLDNTAVSGGYDKLLEEKSQLRQLSLSRCKIDDDTVKEIALKLAHPLPASHTLSLLNLASNRITDTGAIHLATALKTNRQLVYLNLSDNSITDKGSLAILDSLDEFALSSECLASSRARHTHYLAAQQKLISEITKELDAFYVKRERYKSINPNLKKNKGQDKNQSDIDSLTLADKAKAIAQSRMGDFDDPFLCKHLKTIDGVVYCDGNNKLACLNLSYNDISYLTVKKMLSVVKYQKKLNRIPIGLVKVSIEGNSIPVECSELKELDYILMSVLKETTQISKKKNVDKKVSPLLSA